VEDFFREYSQFIRAYRAITVIEDPLEKNVSVTYLPPIAVKALIKDLIASQISWKIPGISTDKAVEIIIQKRDRSIIENSYKIEINGEIYESWKSNGKMQIRTLGDYCRIYCYLKRE